MAVAALLFGGLNVVPPNGNASAADTESGDAASDGGFVPALSSATTSTYRDADGALTSNIYLSPVNYRDSSGAWAPIDNTLVDASGSTYGVENAANSFSAKIPQDAAITPVKLQSGSEWVTMRMHGLSTQAADVDNATATFDSTLGADTVAYQAINTGVKESIQLDSAPTQAPTFSYDVDASAGLVPSLQSDGTVVFARPDGTTAFVVPVGYMRDSSSPSAVSTAVAYDLERAGAGWTLRLIPDFAWLTSPSRTYPVTIDPTLGTFADSQDCWLASAFPDGNHCGSANLYLKAGRTDASHKLRSVLKFDISTLPSNAAVSQATVHMVMDASQTVNSDQSASYSFYLPGKSWDGSSTWSSAGAAGSWSGGSPGATAYSQHGWSGASGGDKAFVGFGDVVQGWLNQTIPNRGVLFKQTDEDTNNVLSFYSDSPNNAGTQPYLNVSYMIPPTNLGVSPCQTPCGSTNWVTTSTTPTLYAQSSASASSLTYTWQVEDASVGTILATGTSTAAPNVRASWTVPDQILFDTGQPFAYRVNVNDGQGTSPWTTWQPFTFPADTGGAMSPPAACSTDCTTLTPSLQVLGTTPFSGGQTTLVPVSISGVDPTDVVSVLMHVTVTGASTAGTLKVFDEDYSAPSQATVAYPAQGAGATATYDVEVPISDANDVTVSNAGGPASVSISAYAWRGLDSDAQAVSQAEAEDPDSPTPDPSLVQYVATLEDSDPIEDDSTTCTTDSFGGTTCAGPDTTSLTASESSEVAAFVDDAAAAEGRQQDVGTGTDAFTPGFYSAAARGQGVCSASSNRWWLTSRYTACRTRILRFDFSSGSQPQSDGYAKVSMYEALTVHSPGNTIQVTRKYHLIKRTTAWAFYIRDAVHCDDNCSVTTGDPVECRFDLAADQNCGDVGHAVLTVNDPGADNANIPDSHVTVNAIPPYNNAPPAVKVGPARVRCDRYAYVGGKTGCVMVGLNPTMMVNYQTYPHAGGFMLYAQANRSKPLGAPGSQEPLARLRGPGIKKNRNRAQYLCKTHNPPQKSCDEYPFASTKQGCAQPTYRDRCSTGAVPLSENTGVGRLLAQFYGGNGQRILAGDQFHVKIWNTPT